jgi:D-alanyl-D-alanine carboxypeptidase
MTTKQSQQAIAVAGLRKPHPKSGYGLGLFALDEGPNCGGTILSHNGGVLYSTPDGSRTLEPR